MNIRPYFKALERGVINIHDFLNAIYSQSMDPQSMEFASHMREVQEVLIRVRDQDEISDSDFRYAISGFIEIVPQAKEEVLETLSKHSNAGMREFVPWYQEYCCEESKRRDFDHVRKSSPLQPGSRLLLFGGYSGGGHYWWLNGREYYKATFIGFAQCCVGAVPLVFVELDDEVNLTEHTGTVHKGRFAVLNGGRWRDDEESPIAVHIVEALPADVEAFYSCYPINTGVESHANYRIIKDDATYSAGSPGLLAKEMYQAVDELDEERTVDSAAYTLGVLLNHAPGLLLTVIPALIARMRGGDNTAATIRSLLQDRGPPALRVLVANLPCDDSRLSDEVAYAIAGFDQASKAEVATALINSLTESDGFVRIGVAQKLAHAIGTPLPVVAGTVPALQKALKDENSTVRRYAATALGRLGPEAKAAVPDLMATVTDPNQLVARAAADALKVIDPVAAADAGIP